MNAEAAVCTFLESRSAESHSWLLLAFHEYVYQPYFTCLYLRAELEEVASDSLTLFSHAMELGHPSIFKSFRVLFDLRIWASLIGMFELNNLLISAKCPLSNPSADEVSLISEITKRYPQPQSRDENEDMASVKNWVLDGSGFYRIHSCMNHSCKPNCKARTPRGIEDNAKGIVAVDLSKSCQYRTC